MKPYFIEIWTWADKLCRQINSEAFGVFSSKLSQKTIAQPIFLQKTKPYIHIPNIYVHICDWDMNLGRKELGI